MSLALSGLGVLAVAAPLSGGFIAAAFGWRAALGAVSTVVLIALLACHYGLRIRPNTESLGAGTTSSVVTAITIVILVDALFAIAFRNVGLAF